MIFAEAGIRPGRQHFLRMVWVRLRIDASGVSSVIRSSVG
jgi:hypothetical protein